MLGTVFGVIVVPGLYYVFGSLADGRKLIKKEEDTPLTEEFSHHAKKKHPKIQLDRTDDPAAGQL